MTAAPRICLRYGAADIASPYRCFYCCGPCCLCLLLHAIGAQVALVSDLDAVMERLVAIREAYPQGDLLRMAQERPALLLQDVGQIESDARAVAQLLAGADEAQRSAIVGAVPEAASPATLSRCLATLAAQLRQSPGQPGPVAALVQNPLLLRSLQGGESKTEPCAEYGEAGPERQVSGWAMYQALPAAAQSRFLDRLSNRSAPSDE